MKRVALYTENPKLGRKFELILRSLATVDILGADDAADGYSLVFIDRESFPDIEGGIFLPCKEEDGIIRNTPFLHEDIITLVSSAKEQDGERILRLVKDERCAVLGRDRIPLTDVEYKLLDTLLSVHGFVDRSTLLTSVWGEGADGGVLTVYVHYLREKLECHGEKVIITSRTHGYAIDAKYRG